MLVCRVKVGGNETGRQVLNGDESIPTIFAPVTDDAADNLILFYVSKVKHAIITDADVQTNLNNNLVKNIDKRLISCSMAMMFQKTNNFLRNASMKKTLITCGFMTVVPFMASLTANGASVIYTGSISPTTLGANATTDLPQFDSTMGTLTGVQVTLDFTVTPYASVGNFSSSLPLTFTPSDSIVFGYSPADIWTISYGSDSWNLAAPTVSTGTIYGSGQAVPYYFSSFTFLQLVGSTSAAADLTAASGLDFAAYTGVGNLVFETTGSGQVSITAGGLAGGGGGNLTGTASVTYQFVPVPEPTTLAFLCLGGLALVMRKRQ